MAGRIIVGVDFSATAARAVREGRALAARLGSVLEIVHVREAREGGQWTPDETARAWLEREGLAADDLTTRGGVPWVELVRLTSSRGADLLVLGTHGRTGTQPLALGTTAARVVLSSPKPVVLVGDRGSTGRAGAPHEPRAREACS